MAMGLAVSDDQIFTTELNKNGLKVMNLSVSSYGTARELLFLKRWADKINTKKLKQ